MVRQTLEICGESGPISIELYEFSLELGYFLSGFLTSVYVSLFPNVIYSLFVWCELTTRSSLDESVSGVMQTCETIALGAQIFLLDLRCLVPNEYVLDPVKVGGTLLNQGHLLRSPRTGPCTKRSFHLLVLHNI